MEPKLEAQSINTRAAPRKAGEAAPGRPVLCSLLPGWGQKARLTQVQLDGCWAAGEHRASSKPRALVNVAQTTSQNSIILSCLLHSLSKPLILLSLLFLYLAVPGFVHSIFLSLYSKLTPGAWETIYSARNQTQVPGC